MTVYQSSRTPVVPGNLIPPGTERISGPYYPLRAMVAKAQRSGELTPVTSVRLVEGGRGEVDVVRHRAPRSPWIARSVIGALILTPLFAIGYMIKMIMDSIAAIDWTGTATGILFIFGIVALGIAIARRPGRYVEGTFRARIK